MGTHTRKKVSTTSPSRTAGITSGMVVSVIAVAVKDQTAKTILTILAGPIAVIACIFYNSAVFYVTGWITRLQIKMANKELLSYARSAINDPNSTEDTIKNAQATINQMHNTMLKLGTDGLNRAAQIEDVTSNTTNNRNKRGVTKTDSAPRLPE